MSNNNTAINDKKYVGKSEFAFYLIAIFFYTMITGMVGNYKQAFLVNVLVLPRETIAFYNGFLSVAGFVMSFFTAMYIDGHKPSKKGKFRPIGTFIAIPCALSLILTFVAPSGLSSTLLLIYLITIGLAYTFSTQLGNVFNLIANVMTPNNKERDQVISFRSISSAVGNSAPLVVVLVISEILKAIKKNNPESQMHVEAMQYIIGASLCAAIGAITMLIGMRLVRERTVYSQEKKNPLIGIKDILVNKYAWVIIISEFLKNFRGIATYMGIFLAAALLGDSGKFLFFGLPTGIGTAVGMLIINFLLKKFNSKQLYIASGIYSVIANTAAFAVGYAYFTNPTPALQIIFIVFLFLIGLQFGASNLLPSMFQADVLETIELDTGKRLDASLPFVIGIGTMISGTIATTVSPLILLGEDSVIKYIQPEDGIYPEQSTYTKIAMLFFYTIFHGIMMLLAGLPFLFYKLTGKTKDDIHEAVLKQREQLESSQKK